MKSLILTYLFLIFYNSIFGQNNRDTVYRFGNDSMICKVSNDITPEMVFTKVEVPPHFPGGEIA